MKRSKMLALILAAALILSTLSIVFVSAADNSAIIYGDADGDGTVTAADARAVLRFAVALDPYTDAQKKISDVDGDGNITSADARLILRYAVKLDSSFPVQNNASSAAATTTGSAVTTTAAYIEGTTRAGSATTRRTVTTTNAAATTTTKASSETTTNASSSFTPYGDLATLQSGKFHVKGTSYTSEGASSATPMELAVNGNDLYMSASKSGVQISMLILNNNFYMACDSNKEYTNPSSIEMGLVKTWTKGTVDLEKVVKDLKTNAASAKASGTYIKTEQITEDGKTYTAHYYATDATTTTRYLMDGNTLVKTETLDASGNITAYMTYSLISSDTSSVLVDPGKNGYSKQGFLAFIIDLSKLMAG